MLVKFALGCGFPVFTCKNDVINILYMRPRKHGGTRDLKISQ